MIVGECGGIRLRRKREEFRTRGSRGPNDRMLLILAARLRDEIETVGEGGVTTTVIQCLMSNVQCPKSVWRKDYALMLLDRNGAVFVRCSDFGS